MATGRPPICPSSKKKLLSDLLQGHQNLAVALSGGVDSALLLAEAKDVLGDKVLAITARSVLHPKTELDDAVRIAEKLSVPHLIVDSHETDHPDFLANTSQRCYICKKMMLDQLARKARSRGFAQLAHGANADDCADFRPGLQAAVELKVIAPLMEAGLTKAEIRQLARQRGLFVWDKPAMACLATRFPYNDPIRLDRVEQVRQAERILAEAGFTGCRVRCHKMVARIEVPADQLPRLVTEPLRRTLTAKLRALGFVHVAADLEGYVSGSMNRELDAPTVDSGKVPAASHGNSAPQESEAHTRND